MELVSIDHVAGFIHSFPRNALVLHPTLSAARMTEGCCLRMGESSGQVSVGWEQETPPHQACDSNPQKKSRATRMNTSAARTRILKEVGGGGEVHRSPSIHATVHFQLLVLLRKEDTSKHSRERSALLVPFQERMGSHSQVHSPLLDSAARQLHGRSGKEHLPHASRKKRKCRGG